MKGALFCVLFFLVPAELLSFSLQKHFYLRVTRLDSQNGENQLDCVEADFMDSALATEGTLGSDGLLGVQAMGKRKSKAASVWETFGEVAATTQASNLGQGFPDWKPPQFMLDSLQEAIGTDFHQYTRPAGHPPLVKLLGERYSKHFQRTVNPMDEVAVTVGASQALFLSFMTLLKPGDEVVMFEPFFDLYKKQLKAVEPLAVPKYVRLGGSSNPRTTESDPWALDIEALDSAITDKTKILLLNSPHNPTGKVFTKKEYEAIAEIVRKRPNLVVISDEVYKFSVYNAIEEGDETSLGHYHFARFPDMFDRTITLSSCGKTFSVTGWQVGWMVGPSRFVKPIHDILPCVQFCTSTPVQHALQIALQEADKPYMGKSNYYEWLRGQFSSKRLILERGLLAAGLKPLPSQGGYFLMTILPNNHPLVPEGEEPYDWRFCRMFAEKYGVVGIPSSSFFSESEAEADDTNSDCEKTWYARFAFCKKDKTMLEASERLENAAAKFNIERQ